MKRLERGRLDGVELEYEVSGAGEPVVLIHWGVSTTWAEPLVEEPALADRYRLLAYHRAGFGGSSPIDGPISMADHAEHCQLLMGRLGIERAHIVGHSSSAIIALQLALDAPDAVHTLVLMEAARPLPPSETQAAFVREFVEPAVGLYRAADREGAVDTWFRGVFGSDYRAALDKGLPGAFEQAVAGADVFFGRELPAVQQWLFTREDPSRITQPALAVLGENTAPPSPSDASSCCAGFRTPSLSSFPTRHICCMRRTLAAWPKAWLPSSLGTRSQRPPELAGFPTRARRVPAWKSLPSGGAGPRPARLSPSPRRLR